MRRSLSVIMILLLGGLGLCGLHLQAQSIWDNVYMSVGAGWSTYDGTRSVLLNPVGTNYQLTVGKLMLRSVGVRAQYQQSKFEPLDTSDAMYHNLHADLYISLLNAISGVNPNRRVQLDWLMGMGAVCQTVRQRDNDFYLNLGLRMELALNYGFYFFVEQQNAIYPPEFDYNEQLSWMPSLSAGLSFHVLDNDYRYSRGESRSTLNDWFFSIAAGVNSLQYKGISSYSDRLRQLTPAVELALGKNLSYHWALRMQCSGVQVRSDTERATFWNLHGDLMLNLSTLLSSNQKAQPFSLMPYVGGGLLTRSDHKDLLQFALIAGLYSRLTIGARSDVYLDLRYALTPPRFAHVAYSQTAFSVGVATVSLGYVYNIGVGTCRASRGVYF